MLVADWMSTTVIKVEPGISVMEAIEIQAQNDVSMLPVVQDEKLVGTVADIRNVAFDIPPTMKVEDIMSRAPVTVPFDFTVEEAAGVMLTGKVPGLVVVDEKNRIVGVITQTDLNRVLVSVTGLWRGGIAFGFLIEDVPGSIKALTDILRAFGARLESILTASIRAPKGHKRVHIRARGLDRTRLDELEERLKEKATLLYRVDQRMNTRKLYFTPEITETHNNPCH